MELAKKILLVVLVIVAVGWLKRLVPAVGTVIP